MNGQRYDQVRRIWLERAPTWRRVPLPVTSDHALLAPKPTRSRLAEPPTTDEGKS